MFLGICELSGQPLATATDKQTIVVTPSGHVCFKHLLLTKLSENGGMDPFDSTDPTSDRPLSEDDLIELSAANQTTATSVTPTPRPTTATSMPSLLGLIQKEYDALVLELFDTRQALEGTRKELSQALYQNDAAVRVVGRLSQERDVARQELAQWKQAGGGSATLKSEQEPATKRQKIELNMQNDIPDSHVEQMANVRDELHASRKAVVKAAASAAPSPEDLKDSFVEIDSKAYHKSTCKAILAMASHEHLIVTAGKDKQVNVYDSVKKVVVQKCTIAAECTALDMNEVHVIAADKKGQVSVFSVADGSTVCTEALEDTVVDARLHPTKVHAILTLASGKVVVLGIEEDACKRISTFSKPEAVEYTCGVLHPDGLIYAAGTKEGTIDLWDFKNKVLASTMEGDDTGDAILALEFSNNGYHMASCHASSAVKAWDLRKQKVMVTINKDDSDDHIAKVQCLSFDHGGKYLAYGGAKGVVVTTVKEWGVTAKYSGSKLSGLAWGPSSQWIATCTGADKKVRFLGMKE